MREQVAAGFENVEWDQTTYDQAAEGPALHRASIRRRFAGQLNGESTAVLLMCAADDDNAGYTAVDRFSGSIGERRGSFVFQHSGIVKAKYSRSAMWFQARVPVSYARCAAKFAWL